MNHWLIKSEPSQYSYDDLVSDKRTVWDGITNNQALMFLREMQKGDRVFFYHTGTEKAIVGVAKIVRDPYPDPGADDDKLVVVDVAPERRVPKPIPLSTIKSDDAFADFFLVRNSRLSVMPVAPRSWAKLCALAGIPSTG